MKGSLKNLCHTFNTHRMVREYTERFYLPAFERFAPAGGGFRRRFPRPGFLDGSGAARMAAGARLALEDGPAAEAKVGDLVGVRARLRLGALPPADVTVELYLGALDAAGELTAAGHFPDAHMPPARAMANMFSKPAASPAAAAACRAIRCASCRTIRTWRRASCRV
jgi:glycogen phosphorylase